MKLVSRVLTEEREAGAEGGQGVTLQNGVPRYEIIGPHWLLSGRYATKTTQKASG